MEYKTVGNIKIPQNLSPEKQAIVDEIARNYVKQNKIIDTDDMIAKARIGLGSLVSGASFHPIMNIPYVGTGIGGALYDLGQGIVEGDKASGLAKRAGRGFAIGETVGAVPYVGKAANKLSGGKIGEVASQYAQKITGTEVARGVENALMQEFNPVQRAITPIKRKLDAGLSPFAKTEKDTQYLFVGENGFNVPKGKLMEAQQMAMYGDSNADIRNATGWFKGVDGKWRYEIPDGNLIENPNLLEQFDDDIGTYYTGKIKDVYDAPELYKNYPQIANRDVVIQSMPDLMEGNSWGDSIALNKRFLTKSNPEFTAEMNRLTQTPEYKAYDNAYNIRTGDSVKDFANIQKAQKEFFETDIGKKYHNLMWEKNPSIPREVEGWNEDTLDTLVHELQHQIQDIEGFAKGGSSKNPNYHNLAGEVEARLAGARAKLTPEQRQIYNPANESSYLTNYGYDVIPEKQIVKAYDKTINAAKDLKYRNEWIKIDGKDYRILNLPKKDYGKILHSLDTNMKIDDNIGDVLTRYDDKYAYTFKKTSPTEYKFIKRRKLN